MAAAAPEAENLQYEMNPEDIQMFDLEKKRKILAVLFFENKIGAAFYSEDNEMLYVFVDSEESSPHFETFEMLVTQIEPTTIVLNVNCNDILKQKANNLMSDVESMPSIPGDVEIESDSREPQPSTSSGPKNRTSVSSNRSPNVSYIPERYFNEQYARKKLMDYVENKDRRTEESRFVFLSSLINTTNSNLWRSIGGLIKFLEVVEEKTGDKICVIGLQSFFPENRMFVENTTVEALQIFKCDWHPSAYKSGSFKDGFCVFSKFNRCITRVGKAYMRKIFQHPLTDLPTINERLNFLEIFGQPERTTICDDIKFHIKYVAPMHKVVKRMMIGHAPIKDWRMLHRTLRSAIEIFGFLRNCDESIAKSTLVERYLQVYRSDVISNLFETIDRTIDFRKSLKEDVFHVNPGVCETLDKQTELYIQLPNILSAEFENDIPLLRGVVEDAQMVYLPQIGFVIKVPLMGGEANGNIQGLEFRAVADGNAFYKSSTCVRLDNDIGDIECLMQDERVTIMYSLQDDVLRTAGYIYEAIDILAEIDW
ncbi:mutS protein 5-like isoform X1 [Leptotrombidium deliense]|uniref:MutS protein 5-like isoform X1 n=1 Tax=Leptotrombidium deliense TaxID=299467 RepID=A0A443SPG6_9ACAR|nr:mutS protein 5-like isoform X1 [Leptotrombidium deliense]